jgi:hypothetical protein
MRLLTIATTVLVLAGLQAGKPAQSVQVPKWSVYELALTASDAQEDPYIEVDLVGVFSGPNGKSVIVNGFWDGDRTFRVRFTPTVEGTWTYMTVSSDRAMDGQMGSVLCTAPQPGAHGFVRGPAARPAAWTFDDGASAAALDARVVPLRANAATCGANCGALPSMDRDHLSLATLRLADRAVQEAQANGSVAELMLFDTFDTSKFDDLQAHRIIDYALARYGAYTNVAWCLHPPAAPKPTATAMSDTDTGSARPWSAMRGVIRMDDPYFVHALALRVLVNECSVETSTAP